MGRVKLWHGTTLDRAKRIRTEGFQPVDISSEMGVIAERYDVMIDVLRRSLHEHDRFAVTQVVRSDLTWLTTNWKAAERWAARAPELRWEALWAVWWVTRDSDDPNPWNTPEAAGWHVQQCFELKPGVIEMEVPVRRVLGSDGEAISPGDLRSQIRLNSPELSIRPHGEVHWVKAIQPTRRPIEFTAVAGLLRVPTDDLVNAVNAGQVPEPRPGMSGTDWTWFEDELPGFVPQELLENAI